MRGILKTRSNLAFVYTKPLFACEEGTKFEIVPNLAKLDLAICCMLGFQDRLYEAIIPTI